MRAVSRSSIVAAADADIDVAVTTGTDSESHDSHDQTSSSSVDSLSTQAASARTTGTDVSGAGHLTGSGKYYRPTPRWPGGHINPRDDTARCTITLDNEFEFVQQVEDYNNSGQFYKQFKVYAGKKVFVRERRGSRLGNIVRQFDSFSSLSDTSLSTSYPCTCLFFSIYLCISFSSLTRSLSFFFSPVYTVLEVSQYSPTISERPVDL